MHNPCQDDALQWIANHSQLAAQTFSRHSRTKSLLGEQRGGFGSEEGSLLHCAASQGLSGMIQPLLASKNIPCDMADCFGRTALHWAADQGHLDVVHSLLKAGACIDLQSKKKATPLMLAALRGNEEIVRFLLGAGADKTNRTSYPNDSQQRDHHWRSTALHSAAAGGHLGVVSALVNASFDKEQHNEAGLTPAEISARMAHPSSPTITRHLLPSDRGGRLIHDYVNMVMEDEKIVAGLVQGGASLDWQDGIGDTPLHRAAHFQHVNIFKILLEAGAEVNIRNRRGGSPLHVAACNGCISIAAALLKAGADKESRMTNGRSPLHLAVINNNEDMVRLLLNNGAYTEHRDVSRGQTPLSEASEYCLAPIIRALLKSGADIESRSSAGLTPLHWACRFNSPESVETLLQAGADPDAVDNASAEAALPSPFSSTLKHTAASVIGLGDPCRSTENPRRRFFGEAEGVADSRLNPVATDRIASALQHARYDRAWRRRGWLVVLARRIQETAPLAPKHVQRVFADKENNGKTLGAMKGWKGRSTEGECSGGQKLRGVTFSDPMVEGSVDTIDSHHILVYDCGIKRPKYFNGVMLASASSSQQQSAGDSKTDSANIGVGVKNKEYSGEYVLGNEWNGKMSGCSSSPELTIGTIKALLGLALVEAGVFRNALSYI